MTVSDEIERSACRWIGKCLNNKEIPNYEALSNGIDLLNLLSSM
jgi:hypothetical protein